LRSEQAPYARFREPLLRTSLSYANIVV